MQFIIFLCRFQVWNCVGRCNFMKFHAFLCRFQVWNCIDRCNVSHVYAILKCETLSFDVIWKNIILLWVHALFRDPLVDPGIEHEPRRFFDAFCWEIKPAKFQDLWFSDFWDDLFFTNFLWFFCFLSLLLARSRRAVANLDERVKKFIHTAFVWPVEVGEILMRLLILKVNKLVWIITRRKWLVSKIALGDQ